MSKPRIAIGCIIQWYEAEMYMEYLQSVVNAIKYSDSNDNVSVDLCFYLSENIEQLDTNLISKDKLINNFKDGEQFLIDNNILNDMEMLDVETLEISLNSLDNSLMESLGWKPTKTFDERIQQVSDWYLSRNEWLEV